MEHYFNRWINFTNNPLNISHFDDEIEYGDLCLNYKNKYYIRKEPYRFC